MNPHDKSAPIGQDGDAAMTVSPGAVGEACEPALAPEELRDLAQPMDPSVLALLGLC